jgi:hypothetical protein
MPKTVVFEGVKHTFPDDFTDEDIAAALEQEAPSETPAEAAPERPVSSYVRGGTRGVGQGLLSMVDVPATLKTIGAVADVPRRVVRSTAGALMGDLTEGRELVGDVSDVASGIKNLGSAAIGLEGAEAMGEAHGNLLTGAIPVGGLLGKAAALGKASRAKNILKAVAASKGADKAKIKRLVKQGRLEDVPVSTTRGSFVENLDEIAEASAGPQLDAAKAGLPGLPPVSVDDAITALKGEREMTKGLPQQVTVQPRTPAGLTAQKPAPVTTTVIPEGSGNQPLVSAMDKQIDELVRLAGVDKKMSADQIQKFKEQAQSAGKYTAVPGSGAAEASAAQAAETTASKLRDLLETSTDIPADVRAKLIAANDRMEDLETMRKPATARVAADADKSGLSRSGEMLLGRGLFPPVAAMVLGGSASLASGGLAPIGAAVGLGVHSFMQSTLFNTLSAAAKLKVAKIMQTQGAEAAVQAAFAAHITENAARRAQEKPQ